MTEKMMEFFADAMMTGCGSSWECHLRGTKHKCPVRSKTNNCTKITKEHWIDWMKEQTTKDA
jgi:hypothetical protein